MPKKIEFNSRQKREIIRLYRESNLSFKKIGEKFNVSKTKIKNFLISEGIYLKGRNYSGAEENRKEIIRLYLEENKSAREIAEIFNYKSRNPILKILKANNLKIYRLSRNRISERKNKSYEKIYGMKRGLEVKKRIKSARVKQILPMRDTSIEVKIQDFLKQLGIDFLTHQYIKDIEHGYQCDILIPSMNLVIECDGNYWHKYPIGNELDHIRTSELIQKGFKVLRLWEIEIKKLDLKGFEAKLKSGGEENAKNIR